MNYKLLITVIVLVVVVIFGFLFWDELSQGQSDLSDYVPTGLK